MDRIFKIEKLHAFRTPMYLSICTARNDIQTLKCSTSFIHYGYERIQLFKPGIKCSMSFSKTSIMLHIIYTLLALFDFSVTFIVIKHIPTFSVVPSPSSYTFKPVIQLSISFSKSSIHTAFFSEAVLSSLT